MLNTLIKAAEMLARRGINSKEADMVLFAMLEDGIGYTDALRYYAEFEGRSRTEIEGRMEEAARDAWHRTGIRYILEDCYKEAIRCEQNIS